MVLPLKDQNPTHTFPFVLVGLLALNFLVFFYELFLPMAALEKLFLTWGVTPYYIFNPFASSFDPGWLIYSTIITSMFLHGGWSHLLGNMLFLWVFGNNVEEAVGHGRFLIFYLLAGIVAAAMQTAFYPGSRIPSIGASGAIAGILGAYIILFPRARVMTIIMPFFFLPFYLPTYIVIGFWFLLQVFMGVSSLTSGAATSIAFFAHIGGFVTGVLLIGLFKRKRFQIREDHKW